MDEFNNDKKEKIEIVKGKGKDLNISDVKDNLNFEIEDINNNKKDIVIPQTQKKEQKEDDDSKD